MGMFANSAHLIRSSPVRLAIGLVMLFALVNLVSLGLAWLQIRNNVENQIAADLEQQIAGFGVTNDPRTLALLVEAEAAAVDPERRIIVFIAPNGASFGNAKATFRGQDLQLTPHDDGRPLSDLGYEIRSRQMAQGVLVVAESRATLKTTETIFVRMLIFSIIPTLLVSLGAGIWIALASARRVRRIEQTLSLLETGDLAARVGDTHRDDDFARIGSGIDRMAEAQEASISALRQVSADIAHDLKTPVQRISVLLSDLGARLAEGSPEAAITERATLEAERAVSVFQSLLMIAQIESGGGKTRFGQVDLSEVIRTFVEIYSPAAEDSGHALTLRTLPPDPVCVRGDRGLLGQLIANLIENCLRHTPKGTEISIEITQTAREIVLCIADSGPGIPEGERQKVLQRLYRLERSRTTPGNGLGLSLVQAITDLHGARLSLHDNAPGLRVRVGFPIPSAIPEVPVKAR